MKKFIKGNKIVKCSPELLGNNLKQLLIINVANAIYPRLLKHAVMYACVPLEFNKRWRGYKFGCSSLKFQIRIKGGENLR